MEKGKIQDSFGKLHFTEIELLKLIREKRNGKLFISIKDGLPMSGFMSNRQAVRFTQKAVTGYSVCYMHGANPKNHGGAPNGNKNAMIHGIFSNDLQDEEEKQLYQEYYQALQKDFELNNSSDRMTCQMVCIFFIRLRRAVNHGKTSDIAMMESLVRNQLKDAR